jgi:hypothetical protein
LVSSTDMAASRIALRVRERGPPSTDTDMYPNIAQVTQNGTSMSHFGQLGGVNPPGSVDVEGETGR